MGPEPYASMARALDRAGLAQPVMLLDRNRLDSNLATLRAQGLPQALRLVVKSLPSMPLLKYAMAALGTRRLMSFHRPFLQTLLEELDDIDILLGKPLPAAAVHAVLAAFVGERRHRLDQVQWLVDTESRLQQYLQLARKFDVRLRIAVEINVGMLRGGLDYPEQLPALLDTIDSNSEWLRLSGLMGYDAHAAKLPVGRIRAAIAETNARYSAFIERLPEREGLVFNGAGSPTHVLHDESSPLNDISLGSVLLKPTDFDLPQLSEYQPACWIATPVLKRQPGVAVPFVEPITRIGSRIPGLRRDSIFIYGGRWMARPDWPPGMQHHKLYGFSSNQQMMTIPADSALGVDDWVFFRPTQAEAVLLQFGPLQVLADGVLRERWPVLQND